MKNIFTLAILELRILGKDRQALGLLFVMPIVFIIFLTLALQDVYQAKVGKKMRLRWQGTCVEQSEVCRQLVSEMRRFPYEVVEAGQSSELLIELPSQIDATIEALKTGAVLKPELQIHLQFDPTLDQSVRALVQGHLLLALQSVLIGQVHKELQESGAQLKLAIPNASHFSGLVSEQAMGGVILPNPIQQTVPAWALFGMFFIVIPLSNSVFRDRHNGIFKRLLSFPVSRGQLLLAKILPYLLINILQFLLMLGVGLWILPVLTHLHLPLAFSWPALFAVTGASALAATSYGLLVASLTRTTEQASAFGALSVVILAILGGVMIPRVVMPETMQMVAKISPLYWGLEAYHDVILRQVSFDVTLGKVAVLLGFAVLSSGVSLLQFRWGEVD